MQEQVLEYFEAYFGGALNESVSDEDIMTAVYDLIDLTEAVLETISPEDKEAAKQRLIDRGRTILPKRDVGDISWYAKAQEKRKGIKRKYLKATEKKK